MFAQMGLIVMIEKMFTSDKITFQVHGEDLGILIGKHGQTLDAIQYLTNLVAHKEVSGHCHIVVDVENYRARREETLIDLAKRLAAKVKRNRQKVSLEPMNAFERKIIHTALHDDKHIVTESAGDEPFRHIVISYKKGRVFGGDSILITSTGRVMTGPGPQGAKSVSNATATTILFICNTVLSYGES